MNTMETKKAPLYGIKQFKLKRRRRIPRGLPPLLPYRYRPRAAVRRSITVKSTPRELHAFDTGKANSALVNPSNAAGAEQDPATTLCLNLVRVGDADDNRTGRRIYMKYLYIQGAVIIPDVAYTATAPGDIPEVFLAVVLDSQTNGAQLNSENVFTNPAASVTTAVVPMRNLDYSSRFKVLCTKHLSFSDISLDAEGLTTQIGNRGRVKLFRCYLPLADIPVTFSADTGAISDVIDNSLHMIAYCSSTSMAPVLSYNSRLRYYEG